MRKILSFLTILALSSAASAEDWPVWRGPRGDGISTETGIPVRWSENENIAWKTPIPGKGHSSPVICQGRVFVTTCLEKEQKRTLLCLDRKDGKVLWTRDVFESPLEKKHRLNSFSSATPATDGKYVWVAFLDFPKMVVVCYDYAGKEIWKQSPGNFHSAHGFCSSPVLYKDMVILNGDQDDAKAFLVALDKNTGSERWRVSRPGVRSYCTPLIVTAAGKKQLVLSGSKCIASYDPDTGKQWWIIDGPTEQFVASLVFLNDIFFMSAGFPTYHIMGIKPDGEGNVTKTHVLWHLKKETRCYVPSPIAHDRFFFVVNDNGETTCWEAANGKMHWRKQLGKHHSASPVSAGDLLYLPDDKGVTHVLKGSDKFEVVSQNALGDECYASPAISDGQMFMRTLHYLWCIGAEKK